MSSPPPGLSRVAVAISSIAALIRFRPRWSELAAAAGDPAAWLRSSDPDHVAALVAALILWLLAGWVALALSLGLAAAIPGVAAGPCRHVAEAMVPRGLRSLLVTATAASLVMGPVAAAGASPSSAGAGGHPTVAATSPTATAIPWPLTTTPAPRPDLGPGSTSASDPSSRSTAGAPSAPRGAAPAEPAVTVSPGDSLWMIAANRLTSSAREAPTRSQVARAWPRWYQVNRQRIGDDPDLLRPGLRLDPPPEEA